VTDGQLGHDHDAHRCAGLGLNEPQFAADALQRPANVKLPRVQVDIRPAQAEQLATPQPSCQRQDVEGFEPFALDDPQEVPGLLDGQVRATLPRHGRGFHLSRDVPRDQFQAVRIGESVADQRMDLPLGGRTRRAPP
jgi:hypothetical protein